MVVVLSWVVVEQAGGPRSPAGLIEVEQDTTYL